MDQAKQLGEKNILGLLLKFSGPAIVGMLSQALYNVVDRVFIGRAVGTLGIAGITVTFPFMLAMMGFSMLIGVGATALISLRLGAQKKEEAELVVGNAVVLMISIALTITILGLVFLNPLLRLSGASPIVLPYSRDYMQIILMGTIFSTISHGMNNFIRGEGNPKIAMFTMLIGSLLNLGLDPIFIFVIGMGIKGAAIATILSQMVSSVWVVMYFLGGKSLVKIHSRNFRLNLPIVRNIVAIGMAPFAMQIAGSLLNGILNNQLRIHGGDLAVSVFGIIFALLIMIVMPIFGICQGAQPIIGYNYGARSYERVRKTLLLAIAAASGLTLLGFLLAMFFPAQIIQLFNKDDPALTELGTHAMRIFLMMMPIVGFQIVSSHYFQAVGKARLSMLLGLSRQVIILIPALLILPLIFGLNGVWFAGPSADLGSSLLTGAFIIREIRRLKQMQVRNP
ncbi:MAG: MATE family efflux transporter [Deltaproteobacteria bacterium]|nr:MATE family efflux transporter [Deltaproteobacteria bacterium]